MKGSTPTRRDLLRTTGNVAGLSLAGCTMNLWGSDSEPSEPTNEELAAFTTQEQFDALDAAFHEDDGLLGVTNDTDDRSQSGQLAWGESYILRAYLLMYRAYSDTEYVDRFVDHADSVLENRDSERGVTDYRDESRPAWRANYPHTIGRIVLFDDDEHRSLEVRTAALYAGISTVTISSEPESETFDLTVYNPVLDRTTSYDDLTMDPDSEDYAVARVNYEGFRDETPDSCLVTVADVRGSPDDAGPPVSGEFDVRSPHYIYAVHTGLITLPLASFARLVSETPELAENSRYEERAERYLEAAERAVQVHDHQWRETDEGEGYYVFTPGSPTTDESVELPHNQSLAMGKTVAQLAAVTGDSSYGDKALKLARTFKNDLRLDDETYVWSYYWSDGELAAGWTMDDPASAYRRWAPGYEDAVYDRPEDINHGHIDVEFVRLIYDLLESGQLAEEDGRDPPFVEEDLQRLARTYTENVAVEEDGAPAARYHVTGTGTTTGDHETRTAMWNDLADWDDEILAHSDQLYREKVEVFGPGPDTILGAAKLNYWSERST